MRGFSLVELSIVLVILGLLTGGILTGQTLIRAAELRSVTTQIDQYRAAMFTFRDKYFALPGDMRNATNFWGARDANPANCLTASSSGTATCNGNANGEILTNIAGADERYLFWQHLANAGLVEGTYTGVWGSGGNLHSIPSENAATSKLGNGGFTMTFNPERSGHAEFFDGVYGNQFQIGAPEVNQSTRLALFRPEEHWNIDTKLDDGQPAFGKVRATKSTSAVTPNCTTTDVNSTAEYNLTNSAILCAIIYIAD